MFQNLENPTAFDLELIRIIYSMLTVDERQKFENQIKETFSENDQKAVAELARTVLVVKEIKL
jgi:hypothetical protein